MTQQHVTEITRRFIEDARKVYREYEPGKIVRIVNGGGQPFAVDCSCGWIGYAKERGLAEDEATDHVVAATR